jgi:hypothetical protein
VGTGAGGTAVLVGLGVGGVALAVEPVEGVVVAVELAGGVAVTPVEGVPAGWDTKDQSEVGELTGVVDFVACGLVCPVFVAEGCNTKIPMTIPSKITMEMLPIIIVRFIRIPSESTELHDLCGSKIFRVKISLFLRRKIGLRVVISWLACLSWGE